MKLKGKKFPFWAIEVKKPAGSITEVFTAWEITGPAGTAGISLVARKSIHATNYYMKGKRVGSVYFGEPYFKTWHKSNVYKMKDPNEHYKTGIIIGLLGEELFKI